MNGPGSVRITRRRSPGSIALRGRLGRAAVNCLDAIDEIVVPGAPDDVSLEDAKPTFTITKILHLLGGLCVRFDDARLTVLREVVGHDVSVLALIPNPVADRFGSARWLLEE